MNIIYLGTHRDKCNNYYTRLITKSTIVRAGVPAVVRLVPFAST